MDTDELRLRVRRRGERWKGEVARYDEARTIVRLEGEMTRPVVHFEIRGRDAKRLREFYSALFGWKIDSDNAMGILRIEHGMGGPEEGVGGHIRPAEAPGVSIFVQVVDLQETLRRAEELGGRAVMQPFDVPGGPTVAQCADPEGNVIGLVKQ